MLRTWPAVYQNKTKNMVDGLDAYDDILLSLIFLMK
jgi:hypothetical protein